MTHTYTHSKYMPSGIIAMKKGNHNRKVIPVPDTQTAARLLMLGFYFTKGD